MVHAGFDGIQQFGGKRQNPKEENCSLDTNLLLGYKFAPWIQICFPKSYFEREKKHISSQHNDGSVGIWHSAPELSNCSLFQPDDGIGKFE